MIIRSMAFPALLALFVLTDSVIAQPAAISWPDAVGQIAGERAKAETCVALMKKYRDDALRVRGEITAPYSDAVASGLTPIPDSSRTSRRVGNVPKTDNRLIMMAEQGSQTERESRVWLARADPQASAIGFDD
jgi:hypothetical protein